MTISTINIRSRMFVLFISALLTIIMTTFTSTGTKVRVQSFTSTTPITTKIRHQQQQQKKCNHHLRTSTITNQYQQFQPLFLQQKQIIDTTCLSSSSSSEINTIDKKDSSSSNNNKKSLWPKVGDIVRYYDIDGGKKDGQVLVGRISYIQEKLTNKNANANANSNNNNEHGQLVNKEWIFDIVELENVGDGYYTDYTFRKRSSKQTVRGGLDVSPIAASYVRVEQAFKIPIEQSTGQPIVRAQTYDLYNYNGPYGFIGYENSINTNIIENDKIIYDTLKNNLFKVTAISGLFGTIIADFMKGTEYAILYAAGSIASIVYLLLLSLKTDTMANVGQPKLGTNLANLRFITPIIVLICVALYNISLGSNNPVLLSSATYGSSVDEGSTITGSGSVGLFTTVTTDQFGAVIFGFLTYRIPLFLSQIQDAMKKSDNDESNTNVATLPGSATGMLLDMVQKDKNSVQSQSSTITDNLQTVFLISGPQCTGRKQLVERFIKEYNSDNTKSSDPSRILVEPKWIDRIKEPIQFERYDQRKEFLIVDSTGRYGLTKQSIVGNIPKDKNGNSKSVVIIDADVTLVKKIVTTMNNIRVVGVWIGLNNINDFEQQIQNDILLQNIIIPNDETQDSIIRSRIKDIVQEIEYGISCGVFEFTIINTNENDSIQQLREALSYCYV